MDGDVPDQPEALVRAASLWLGGDLVACHSTAALLWGFDLRADDLARREPLHVLGPADLQNRRFSALRVHPSSLGTDDAVLHRVSGAHHRHGRRATSSGSALRSTASPPWMRPSGAGPAPRSR